MWTFTIPAGPGNGAVTISPADLTSAEAGLLYSAVNDTGITHTEDQIAPGHCPLCRNAVALLATLRLRFIDPDSGSEYSLTLEAADELVSQTMPHELRAMIGDTILDAAEPTAPNRAARRAKPAAKKTAAVKKPPTKRAR